MLYNGQTRGERARQTGQLKQGNPSGVKEYRIERKGNTGGSEGRVNNDCVAQGKVQPITAGASQDQTVLRGPVQGGAPVYVSLPVIMYGTRDLGLGL